MAEACDKCYQSGYCEVKGSPLVTQDAIKGGDRAPRYSPNCFFYCCEDGWSTAKRLYEKKQQESLSGLHAFSTQHKPFANQNSVYGRFVALDDGNGYLDGDVIVFVGSQLKRTTNIFEFKPPSCGR